MTMDGWAISCHSIGFEDKTKSSVTLRMEENYRLAPGMNCDLIIVGI